MKLKTNLLFSIQFLYIFHILLPLILSSSKSTPASDEHTTNTTRGRDDEKIDTRIYTEIKNSIHFDNMEDYNEYIYRNDITLFTYYYKKNDTNSKLGAYFLWQMENKLDFLAKIILIDCDKVKQKDSIKQCNTKDKNENLILPRFTLQVPPHEKYNSYTKKINHYKDIPFKFGSVSNTTLHEYITDNIHSHVVRVNAKNIKTFVKSPLMNKILIFTNKESTQLLIKGLSNIFHNKLLIGEVRNTTDNKNVIQEYKVNHFPTILSLENNFFKFDKPIITQLTHKFSNVNIHNFMEKYALKEKLYLRRLFEHTLDQVKSFTLFYNTWNIFFDKFKDAHKIVFFNDDEKIPKQYEKFMNTTNGFFVFAKVNCKRMYYFCSSIMNITEGVAARYNKKFKTIRYYPNTNDVHSSLENYKELNANNLDKFYDTIYNEMFPVPSHVNSIQAKEVSKTIFKSRNDEKYNVLYFYSDEEIKRAEEADAESSSSSYETTRSMQLISQIKEYTDKIDFSFVKNTSAKLMKAFKIDKLPSASIIYHNKRAEEGFKNHKNVNPNFIEMRRLIEEVSILFISFILHYLNLPILVRIRSLLQSFH